MRLYTVSAIDSWQIMSVAGRPDKPRLGKNGGPMPNVSGTISSLENCKAFVAQKVKEGALTISEIRRWRR